VVAEVLLDLEDEVHGLPSVALRNLDLERVVDLRKVAGEDGVDHDAHHLLHSPHVSVLVSHPAPSQPSASAPATTSRISWVISAWRTLFISSVRSPII